jgi:tRNA(Ile)-lysidine synthase
LSGFARRLWQEWRRLKLSTEGPVVVAVSGGADSVALLLALDELLSAARFSLTPVVAHVDHRLRKASPSDAGWVKGLAAELGHDVAILRVDVRKAAQRNSDNLEQAARRARYAALAALAQKRRARIVLTAHTADDQSETILLNLLRGSGADGLSGMRAIRRMNKNSEIELARPLLSWARRSDTEKYCRARSIEFRQDEMNDDETFARVRIRRRLLPLLETFNPRIGEALTRTGELLRADSDALNSAARRLFELSVANGLRKSTQLRVDLLAIAPPAVTRRALRLWLEQCRGDLRRLELVHIRAVETLVNGNQGNRLIELPGGSTVARKGKSLVFRRNASDRKT